MVTLESGIWSRSGHTSDKVGDPDWYHLKENLYGWWLIEATQTGWLYSKGQVAVDATALFSNCRHKQATNFCAYLTQHHHRIVNYCYYRLNNCVPLAQEPWSLLLNRLAYE